MITEAAYILPGETINGERVLSAEPVGEMGVMIITQVGYTRHNINLRTSYFDASDEVAGWEAAENVDEDPRTYCQGCENNDGCYAEGASECPGF